MGGTGSRGLASREVSRSPGSSQPPLWTAPFGSPHFPCSGAGDGVPRQDDARRALPSRCGRRHWPLAMDYAIHTLNKLPTKGAANGRSSPEALWTGQTPTIADQHVFGSTVYVKINTHIGKLDAKAEPAIYLGPDPETKEGHRVYVPRTRRLRVSRDITFVEETSEAVGIKMLTLTIFLDGYAVCCHRCAPGAHSRSP